MSKDPNVMPGGDIFVGCLPLDTEQCTILSQTFGTPILGGLGFGHPDVEGLDVVAWRDGDAWTVALVYHAHGKTAAAMIANKEPLTEELVSKFAGLFLAAVRHRRSCGLDDAFSAHIGAATNILKPERRAFLESMGEVKTAPNPSMN